MIVVHVNLNLMLVEFNAMVRHGIHFNSLMLLDVVLFVAVLICNDCLLHL